MNDELRIYTQGNRTSDGSGGSTVERTNERKLFGKVKPMGGNFAMNFQQLTGSKGYDIWIRTDFGREINIGEVVEYEGIYGQIDMIIHDIDVGKNKTKLICRGASRI